MKNKTDILDNLVYIFLLFSHVCSPSQKKTIVDFFSSYFWSIIVLSSISMSIILAIFLQGTGSYRHSPSTFLQMSARKVTTFRLSDFSRKNYNEFSTTTIIHKTIVEKYFSTYEKLQPTLQFVLHLSKQIDFLENFTVVVNWMNRLAYSSWFSHNKQQVKKFLFQIQMKRWRLTLCAVRYVSGIKISMVNIGLQRFFSFTNRNEQFELQHQLLFVELDIESSSGIIFQENTVKYEYKPVFTWWHCCPIRLLTNKLWGNIKQIEFRNDGMGTQKKLSILIKNRCSSNHHSKFVNVLFHFVVLCQCVCFVCVFYTLSLFHSIFDTFPWCHCF